MVQPVLHANLVARFVPMLFRAQHVYRLILLTVAEAANVLVLLLFWKTKIATIQAPAQCLFLTLILERLPQLIKTAPANLILIFLTEFVRLVVVLEELIII